MAEAISIFIVEDHEMVRLGLKAGLERTDDFIIAGESEDGADAVEQILKIKPRIVLMDIGLPTIDGIEATQRIKNRNSDISIIMLTAQQDEDGIFAAFAAGADGYCMKGAQLSRLVLAIRTVADGASWLDPTIADRVLRAPRPAAAAKASKPKTTDAQIELSEREISVLKLVADGMSNPDIAKQLYLSPETVKSHIRRIMEKLVVDDRTHAAVKALRQGLI